MFLKTLSETCWYFDRLQTFLSSIEWPTSCGVRNLWNQRINKQYVWLGNRQTQICKILIPIHKLVSLLVSARFQHISVCLPYWLHFENTILWPGKSYKIFCPFFGGWFMKSFLYSFINLGDQLKTGSNFTLDFPLWMYIWWW